MDITAELLRSVLSLGIELLMNYYNEKRLNYCAHDVHDVLINNSTQLKFSPQNYKTKILSIFLFRLSYFT